MPVAPPALQILADSDEPRSIQRLAERSNGNYRGYVKAAHDLEDQGAIELRPNGRELLVIPKSSMLTGLANDLLRTRVHPGLVHVFRSDRPVMLWVLHKARRVDLTANIMGRSPDAVRYMIRTLQKTGLIVKEARGHRIHPSHRSLIELLDELDRMRAEHRIRGFASKPQLLWRLGPELLVRSEQRPTEAARPAGLDAFGAYGIDIQTTKNTLFYVGERELTAADLLLQALLSAGYTTPDPRITFEGSVTVGPEFNYACLLWEKEEPQDIWEKSDLYFGKENPARDVVEYVHERSDKWAGFIPWSEHERLRKLYGIPS